MADPTGRWLNDAQWQCPKCGWVNERADERCQSCDASVRPPADEPVRPPDPLDLISHKRTSVRGREPSREAGDEGRPNHHPGDAR